MNSTISINEFAKTARWYSSAKVAQPKCPSPTQAEIAKLDRWTLVAALSSLVSALYLLVA